MSQSQFFWIISSILPLLMMEGLPVTLEKHSAKKAMAKSIDLGRRSFSGFIAIAREKISPISSIR